MAEFVLDASAILAWINKEPGGDVVAAAIEDGVLGAVNLAEVVTKLIEKGQSPEAAAATARGLLCEIAVTDKSAALGAGLLHAQTRGRGVSLADRFCLALAQERDLPVLTGDRAWTALGLDVDIQLIR